MIVINTNDESNSDSSKVGKPRMHKIPRVPVDDLAYVLASKRRLEVILALSGRYITQKHLSRLLSLDYSNVGRSLRQLIKWELAVRLSPGVRKSALYGLSEGGQRIAEYIDYLIWSYNNEFFLEPYEYEALSVVAEYAMKVKESPVYVWHLENEIDRLEDALARRP